MCCFQRQPENSLSLKISLQHRVNIIIHRAARSAVRQMLSGLSRATCSMSFIVARILILSSFRGKNGSPQNNFDSPECTVPVLTTYGIPRMQQPAQDCVLISGFPQKLLGDRLGRGFLPTYPPDFPPLIVCVVDDQNIPVIVELDISDTVAHQTKPRQRHQS
jgi:hypothetical protein